jgi:hypothetical protein
MSSGCSTKLVVESTTHQDATLAGGGDPDPESAAFRLSMSRLTRASPRQVVRPVHTGRLTASSLPVVPILRVLEQTERNREHAIKDQGPVSGFRPMSAKPLGGKLTLSVAAFRKIRQGVSGPGHDLTGSADA